VSRPRIPFDISLRAIAIAVLLVSPRQLSAQELPASDVTVAESTDSGLRLTMFSASSLASAAAASVLIGIEVDGLAETTDGTRQIELSVQADPGSTDIKGAVAISVPLTDAETARRAAREGFRALTRIGLTVGRHELRVTVRDTVEGRAATLLRVVDVPNLIEASITMSNLLISGSRVVGLSHSGAPEDELLPIIGRPPTGRRVFSRSEQIEVNAQIYTAELPDFNADVCGLEQLRITTLLESLDGRQVYETSDIGQSETLPSGVYGYQHYALVQIASLPPGPYVLRVVASDGLTVASRAIPIAIVETR